MEKLNYEVLKKSGYQGYILEKAPEKILQFGEGNFLRAFVDYWFDMSNEKVGWNGKAVLVHINFDQMSQFKCSVSTVLATIHKNIIGYKTICLASVF